MYRSASCFVVLLTLGVFGLAAGCGGGNDTGIPDACNPMGGVACLQPWPSSVYLTEADTATGYQVDLPLEAMPTSLDDRTIDPALLNEYDGFTVSGPLLVAFETGVSADGLPPHTDPSASLQPDSSVVLLDMDTGSRMMIFAEPDMNAKAPEERTLIIRPLERLVGGHRYAVAVRKSVKAADGSELPVPPGFEAVLAGDSFSHPLFGKVADRYEEIFAALEADGVSRDDLVVAWDFVAASDEFLTRDVLTMRSRALPEIGETGENLTFDAEDNEREVEDNPNRLYRFLNGTYDVPMFLDQGEADPSILVRDESGLPALNGTARANFSALIPRCVETATLPIPVIIFGHGLFGDAEEALEDGLLQRVSQDNCMVIVGGDFIGLTGRQFATIAFAMNDLNRAPGITDKLAQAVINFIALGRIVRGPFRESDYFAFEGNEIIDPTRVYYFGASLGGNMGGTLMAYDPDITKGVLGVAGGPWSLLFERSLAWPPLRVAIEGSYAANPWDYEQNVAIIGMLFEKVDLITTAHRVLNDPLPETPPKQIFHYMAMGDALVTNIASDVFNRTLAIPVTGPSLRTPYGAQEEVVPVPSATTIYDEGVEPWPPLTNVSPEDDNGTHGDVHERPALLRQLTHFLLDSEVVNECKVDGDPAPCICDTGACD